MEEQDIFEAYSNGKGSINFIVRSVPFMQAEDKPRIIELVKGICTNLFACVMRGRT